MISHEQGIFEFTLERNTAMVALVQRSALEFAERLVEHAEWRSKLEVAVNELLENSVKYLAAGSVAFRLQISPPPGQLIRISTRNKGAKDHIARLREEIDALKSSDPLKHYQHAMVRAVRNVGESRLGLSRIAAESSMRLDYKLTGKDEIEVSAQALVPG
jgi:hypothetical protein